MIKQKSRFFGSIVFILMSFFLFAVLNSCTPKAQGSEVEQAADLIREYAIKKNPALKGKRLKVNMSIDGVDGAEACACIQVCDSRGQNCTGCSCSPANCGTCD